MLFLYVWLVLYVYVYLADLVLNYCFLAVWLCYFSCYFRVILSSRLLSSFFFFKQKTAYEMRISDWSSDVCSSDLCSPSPSSSARSPRCCPRPRRCRCRRRITSHATTSPTTIRRTAGRSCRSSVRLARSRIASSSTPRDDRKSVVSGKSVSVRVDLGGSRIIKKKTTTNNRRN